MTAPPPGLQLLGVVRRGRTEALREKVQRAADVRSIRVRELAALVRKVDYRVPSLCRDRVAAHQREIDRVLRRRTIVPAPYGIVFPDTPAVERFLAARSTHLEEALSLLEGRWEFRLHCGYPEGETSDPVDHVYTELRRLSRASMPLDEQRSGVASAAYLVERTVTRRFVERVQELEMLEPQLEMDLTGPWPAYDFVRITS